MSELGQRDLAAFASLGIPEDLLIRAGIERVSDADAREKYGVRGGGDMAGIVFPYFEPSRLLEGESRRWYCRLRRDHPELELGRAARKYIAPFQDRKHLYFPPAPELFADTNTPIIFVESEKSSLALTALVERTGKRFLAVGLGGCWGWRGRTGIKETATGERVPETGALPDLNIARDGRKTFVLLDVNARTNPHVLAARRALVKQLKAQGAEVRILDLPPGDWNGPDDFIASKGDDAMLAILESGGTPPEGDNWREIFHSWDEFENAPPLTFAINGFLQESGVTLIGGLAGHGKTLLMLSMAKALLEQSPLFGYSPFSVPRPAARVIYLIPECSLAPFWSRVKMFGLEEFVREDRLLIRTLSAKEQVELTDPRMLTAVAGADVFLDSVIRFTTGSENDAENIRMFSDVLFRLLHAGARTITGCHHSPKSFETAQSMSLENILRGSGDLGAMICTCWGVRQIDAARNRIYIENCKPRDFQPCQPFVLEGRPHLDTTGQFSVHAKPGEAGELRSYLELKGGRPPAPDQQEKIEQALEMRRQGKSNREIAAALGVSHTCIGKWFWKYDSGKTPDEDLQ